jgi:hypothetical protein
MFYLNDIFVFLFSPSLRIRGASAIKEDTKLKLFSRWESELLDLAIKEKMALIKRLKKSSASQQNVSLNERDRKSITGHFEKKLAFYLTQNNTKWKDWPNKKGAKKKVANYKRRQKRRKKRTEDDAKKALESGSVVVLVDKEVPPGAIALLGKGLNFIPTPTENISEEQLDMRLNTNRILRTANISEENRTNIIKSTVPLRLSRKVYTAAAPAEENGVNNIVQKMTEEHNGRLQFEKTPPQKKNVTKDEEEGLRWLIEETRESNIAVVKADKGGAILIIDPKILETTVQEKLDNPNVYTKLDEDPTDSLCDELFKCWVKGKEAEFVTASEATRVMGVTENNNKSTSSHFKPGTSYYYPMMKIHKLTREELVPGVRPPARLVTALQEGISKRSDVFLADRFLKELEENYCQDLLKDTTSALQWLESVDSRYTTQEKKHMKAFTFDFKSLYDNLKPELVKEAVMDAMQTSRPGWSQAKRNWILQLIDISLRASIGKFKENHYVQKNGVPTGGSLCVQLANITVFYIMNKAVYSNPQLMINIKELMRYIDDGAGFYIGSERSFKIWMNAVNAQLNPYGLYIDESIIKEVNEFAPFLDIQFCFDFEGHLQTDLYVKPTDARSYLNFNSAHPKHVFPGIVYSQCLRLRRIINKNDRLKLRLTELCTAFQKSEYPTKILHKISTKVLNMERRLERPVSTDEDSSKPILIVSCHGSDDKLLKTIKNNEEDLCKTDSFKGSAKPIFQFVKKTASNIGCKLSVLKSIALGRKCGPTVPCSNHSNCMCCKLIGSQNTQNINGLPAPCAPGNCKTKNTIYLVTCTLCHKPYIGRTVQPLRERMSGHRGNFYKVLSNEDIDETKDDYSLGLHLVNEHYSVERGDFNRHFKVQIMENCSPSNLEKKEHLLIHKFKTLYPIGLNKNNPFGLSVIS